VTVASIFSAILADEILLLGLPFFYLLIFQTIVDFKKIFWLALISIPISTELTLGPTLEIHMPVEPIMVGLTLVYLIYIIANPQKVNVKALKHPLIILLIIHLVWIFITMLTSNLFIVSLKFFIAKMWYVIVFTGLGMQCIKDEKEVKTFFWVVFLPLLFATFTVFVRLAMVNFEFEDLQSVMKPFFRNHISYSSILALFISFIYLAISWYKRWSFIWLFLVLGFVFIFLSIQFSYTRTAYGGLVLALGGIFVVRMKMIKYALIASFCVLLGGLAFIINDNRYLEFAPNYDKTVTHTDFNSLVEATYKLEDISTMERVYRWVAAVRMSQDELMFGYGPGNFYNFYKGYTVYKFQTYVSDNPEKSGVHSYFLMTLVDQGILGCLIFFALTFAILIYGEKIYHETTNKERANIILAIIYSMIVIDSFLLINDMIETDKVGSFFFIMIGILVNFDLLNQKEKPLIEEEQV
jgi:O-antigen ligase